MTTIEPLAPEHFSTAARWLSQPEINQWLTSEWRGRQVEATLISIAVRNKRNRFFLIRNDGGPCGLVALSDWDPADQVAMIWYALGDPALGGRGVVTQAVQQLIKVSFGELDIAALNAWIMEDNIRSRRVLEKSGFREVGRLRSASVRDGRRLDRVYFDLLREEAP